ARADLILLDVPCSNTGVLARRIHARYRVSPERTASLVQTQRQIIADALRLRSPSAEARGGILYSTCSLDVEENEKQAEWAAHWHAFSKKREHRRAPAGGPGEPAHRYSDGAYAVLLA
ncbi:MAG: hypothetical protein VYC34_05945, partial [Planctomycetota bacterium]|nr:hypothetical protein [Planctomycetota bacterium]